MSVGVFEFPSLDGAVHLQFTILKAFQCAVKDVLVREFSLLDKLEMDPPLMDRFERFFGTLKLCSLVVDVLYHCYLMLVPMKHQITRNVFGPRPFPRTNYLRINVGIIPILYLY